MKRFTFRLAKLERLRDARRRASRVALAEALAEARLRRAERERESEALADARSRPWDAGGSDASELKRLAAWRDGRVRSVELADAAVADAEAVVETAGRKHTEDAREHRVIEKLHAKRWRQWVGEWEREQQKFLDETHLARRHGSTRTGPGR